MLRLLASLAVGAACAAVIAVVLTTLGGGGPEAARAGAPEPAPVAEGVHGGSVPGMSESELRDVETATLGAEHAGEHAAMRAAMRAEESGSGKPAEAMEAKLAAAAAGVVGTPAEVGQWQPAKVRLPIVAIHAALLPTGKVMIFSYPTYPNRPNSAEAYLWDPANPQAGLVKKDPPGKANIWCAGQTFAANGELVVFGGNLDYESPSQTWKGLDQVFTFNPWTETWREQPRMAHGRWYPTGVRMPDGRIPIVGGLDETGLLDPNSHTNFEVELFTPSTALGGLGSLKKIGDGEWWADNEAGQDPIKPPIRELYPRMVSMASGRTILAGPDKDSTWYFNNVDANPFTWSDAPNLNRHRTWGTTVPLPSGPGGPTQLMALGGAQFSGEASTTTTEVFTEGSGSWQLQQGKDNVYGRGHANTVLLPDSSMAQVGGGRGSLATFESPLHYADPEQAHIELWNPGTREWTLGPAQTEARAYHSTAVLLPDGRVMSAGDDFNGDPGKVGGSDPDPMEDTIEIYEPPYLFRGARPTISSTWTPPSAIGFNDSFGVDTPNTNITGAALVAPAAVTHGVDMNQRMLELDVVQRTGCVSVTTPTGPNAAPPGYYMLFLLNDQGVPSVARFVNLQTGAPVVAEPLRCGTPVPPDVASPTATLTKPAAGTVGGTVELQATATDDRGVAQVTFRVDGATIATDTTAPYTASWNSRTATDGPHTLSVVARDLAGKDSLALPASQVQVNVSNTDRTGPTVNFTAPAQDALVTGEITLQATASDPSGILEVQFQVDGENIGAPDTAPPYSVRWNSVNRPNGRRTLTAVALDGYRNPGTDSVAVNVDNKEGEPIDALPPKKPPQNVSPEIPGGGGGGPGGGGGGGGTVNAAPAVSRVKLSATRFRKGRPTKVSFRLSEAARVSIGFERKLAGRRVRGRCTKPKAGARANCTRYLRSRTKLAVQGKAGANTITFRGAGLAVGRYRMTLVAKDAGGKSSKVARLSFELLDRRAARRAAVLSWF